MPRDFDAMQGAISGFLRGRGAGRISGMPEGLHKAQGLSKHSSGSYSAPLPGTGVIRGNPRGIEGKVRSANFKTAMGDAVRRKLRRR